MRRKILAGFLCVLLFILLLLSKYTYLCAKDEKLSKSASLSFIKKFPIVRAERSFGYSKVSIGISVNSTLKYRGNMILYSRSSSKYVDKGKTTVLQIEVSNFVSSVELNIDTSILISYSVGSISVPMKIMHLKYSVLDKIGEFQEVILGEYLLFSGTVPVLGIQINLFMRPIISYTPTLRGILNVIGPAKALQPVLNWNQKSITSSIHFTDTKPVLVTLLNPKLILNDLKVNLEIYAIITTVTVSTSDIELVKLGDYSINSSSINLISI